MNKKELKHYAVTIGYPMELWRDNRSKQKLINDVYRFYKTLLNHHVILFYKRESDKTEKDLQDEATWKVVCAKLEPFVTT